MCSIEVHILHLRGARCGRSAAASAAPSAAPSWAACAREAPSAPNKTPPPSYICALFCPFPFLALIFHA